MVLLRPASLLLPILMLAMSGPADERTISRRDIFQPTSASSVAMDHSGTRLVSVGAPRNVVHGGDCVVWYLDRYRQGRRMEIVRTAK